MEPGQDEEDHDDDEDLTVEQESFWKALNTVQGGPRTICTFNWRKISVGSRSRADYGPTIPQIRGVTDP